MDNNNINIPLPHMIDFLTETEFYDTFTKYEISRMSEAEVFRKKLSIRNTLSANMNPELAVKEVNPELVTHFGKYTTYSYYPDNYIGDKPVSNR